MPWSPKQHALFQVAAHNKAIAEKHGMAQSEAAKMASEGVKNKMRAKALMQRNQK